MERERERENKEMKNGNIKGASPCKACHALTSSIDIAIAIAITIEIASLRLPLLLLSSRKKYIIQNQTVAWRIRV